MEVEKLKILIIGGTGTISGGIAKEIIKRGEDDVTLLNRGNTDFRSPSQAVLVHCDINDTQKVNEYLKDKWYDVIVDPITYNTDQLKTRLRLFEGHCKTYVFISSACAIGNNAGEQDENTKKDPKWSYGINKLKCEKFLERAKLSFDYIIIRPSITYGDIRIPIPVACRKNPYTVINRIKNDKPLVCFEYLGGNVTQHKLMDIRDFSAYAVELFGKEYSRNNDYIICADKAYTWEEAYDLLYKKLNAEKHIYEVKGEIFKYFNPSLYEDYLYDKGSKYSLFKKDKIKKDTGIKLEEISLEDGISTLVDYLQENYASLPLETSYDLMTDAILFYEIKNKDCFLTNYFKSLDSEYMNEISSFYKQIKFRRNFICLVLKKIKRMLKI